MIATTYFENRKFSSLIIIGKFNCKEWSNYASRKRSQIREGEFVTWTIDVTIFQFSPAPSEGLVASFSRGLSQSSCSWSSLSPPISISQRNHSPSARKLCAGTRTPINKTAISAERMRERESERVRGERERAPCDTTRAKGAARKRVSFSPLCPEPPTHSHRRACRPADYRPATGDFIVKINQ